MSTIDIIKPEGVRKEVRKCLAGLSSLGSGKIRYLGPYRHIDTMAGGRNASGMLEEDGANMCNILSVFQDKVIFDGHTTLKQSFEYWTRKMLDSSFFIRQPGITRIWSLRKKHLIQPKRETALIGVLDMISF